MRFWRGFLSDECGAVMSAEMVMLATLGVVGATAGLKMAATSINEELKETALAFRSLDQSFEVKEQRSCRAWTAGSCYRQPPVEESRAALSASDTDRLPADEGPQPELKPKKKPDAAPSEEPKPKKKKKPKDDDDDEADGQTAPLFDDSRSTDA